MQLENSSVLTLAGGQAGLASRRRVQIAPVTMQHRHIHGIHCAPGLTIYGEEMARRQAFANVQRLFYPPPNLSASLEVVRSIAALAHVKNLEKGIVFITVAFAASLSLNEDFLATYWEALLHLFFKVWRAGPLCRECFG